MLPFLLLLFGTGCAIGSLIYRLKISYLESFKIFGHPRSYIEINDQMFIPLPDNLITREIIVMDDAQPINHARLKDLSKIDGVNLMDILNLIHQSYAVEREHDLNLNQPGPVKIIPLDNYYKLSINLDVNTDVNKVTIKGVPINNVNYLIFGNYDVKYQRFINDEELTVMKDKTMAELIDKYEEINKTYYYLAESFFTGIITLFLFEALLF